MPATQPATQVRPSRRPGRIILPGQLSDRALPIVSSAQVLYPDALLRLPEASAESPPVILSARPLLGTCPTLAPRLRDARCELLLAATWERLVVSCEKTLADVILVDYDAVEHAYRAGAGRQRMSGHRLVSLLARSQAAQTHRRPRALVVLSQMDYAELEDLMRLGIHALERPDQPDRLVGNILAAYWRVAQSQPDQTNQTTIQNHLNLAHQHASKPSTLVTDAAWAVISTALAMAGVAARRTHVSDRVVFEGVCSLLQTGAPWRMYPAGSGSASLARRRLAAWRAAGVFTRLGWAAQSGAHAIGPIMALPWDRLTTPAPRPKATIAHAIPIVSYTDWALAVTRE